MRSAGVFSWLLLITTTAASAQLATIHPQVRSQETADPKITTIQLTAHFVTAIRVPEAVNSVVVGDPALFQVEHSEHEPYLVFVKALTTEDAESNLLISTAKGRQISFLLVSHGRGSSPAKVDFLLRYQTAGLRGRFQNSHVAIEPLSSVFLKVLVNAKESSLQPTDPIQEPKINGFNAFPSIFAGTIRQI